MTQVKKNIPTALTGQWAQGIHKEDFGIKIIEKQLNSYNSVDSCRKVCELLHIIISNQKVSNSLGQ